MSEPANCVIMGAAGRDFHDFLRFFRSRPAFRVRAFTATQIPFIECRAFPHELAGPWYDADIPIHAEEELAALIDRYDIDWVFLSYSDLSHEDVMHKASLVQSLGANFALLGPRATELRASRPVIAVVASRTGAGKSPVSQWIAKRLRAAGHRVGVIRHPMPYGDLAAQTVQRFAHADDLMRHACTIEEREEYAPYLDAGLTVFAGLDYQQVLAAAEAESDVILWDGGNNDSPFVRADLLICVLDALRPGHEMRYYPGESNLRRADVVIINKVGTAARADIERMRGDVTQVNPQAEVLEADLAIDVERPATIGGRRVLVVEDGPTLTHGGMSHGAGLIAARRYGAAALIDPRPFAVGTIADTLAACPHLQQVLPALGYSPPQLADLAATINAAHADLIVDASPCDLGRLIRLTTPTVRVRYRFEQTEGVALGTLIDGALARWTPDPDTARDG
jgi:predicted GTPase